MDFNFHEKKFNAKINNERLVILGSQARVKRRDSNEVR